MQDALGLVWQHSIRSSGVDCLTTKTTTNTHVYIYIYIYTYTYVSPCICVFGCSGCTVVGFNRFGCMLDNTTQININRACSRPSSRFLLPVQYVELARLHFRTGVLSRACSPPPSSMHNKSSLLAVIFEQGYQVELARRHRRACSRSRACSPPQSSMHAKSSLLASTIEHAH